MIIIQILRDGTLDFISRLQRCQTIESESYISRQALSRPVKVLFGGKTQGLIPAYIRYYL